MKLLEWIKNECIEWEKELDRFNQCMNEAHIKILNFFGMVKK